MPMHAREACPTWATRAGAVQGPGRSPELHHVGPVCGRMSTEHGGLVDAYARRIGEGKPGEVVDGLVGKLRQVGGMGDG